jgi:peptidoglycan/xylan/chitin deacetylase (PgdA/CDA1 family)
MASTVEPGACGAQVDRAMDSDSARLASRLMKLVIGLAFYGVSESWRALQAIFGRRPTPHAVVIYYHHVLKDQREGFARQLDHLRRFTEPLRADLHEPLTPNGRYSIVTADDGWKSFADNALPELARRNIPVTMFAISQRLGQSVDGITFDRLLDADELRALDAGNVTIGSHTATHAVMTALNEAQATRELCESREQLGAILGRDVTMFCFPYGASRDDLVPLCRSAGYTRVFTCVPVPADPGQYVLGRVRVDPTDWPLEFHLKLMGAYRWLPIAIALKRRIFATIRGGSHFDQQSPEIPAA